MTKDKSLEISIKKLLIHYQKKEFKIAKDLANDLTKEFPKNNFSWQVLFLIFVETGKLNEAYDAISQAVKIDPLDFKAQSNLGSVLFRLGLLDKSISTFKEVLKLDNNNFNAYINLGVIYQKKKELKKAENSYLKAIEINPNSKISYNNLGNTLKELNRLDEAELNYNRALKLDSNYDRARENLNFLFKEKKILKLFSKNKIEKKNKVKFLKNPFVGTREVEPDLVSTLYKIKSIELKNAEGGPLFGNGSTTNYDLFKNDYKIINILKNDLIKIMKKSVDSDIYINDSFLNILKKDSGSFPHTHIVNFDKNNNLINHKYSLVYYVSVGDQKVSKPGIFKIEDPHEEILPKEGTIIIIPAHRKHSATYNGKIDRLMVGINFYSLN